MFITFRDPGNFEERFELSFDLVMKISCSRKRLPLLSKRSERVTGANDDSASSLTWDSLLIKIIVFYDCKTKSKQI